MAELHWVLLHVLWAVCISLPLVVTSGDTAKQSSTAYQPAEMTAQIGQPITLSCQFNLTKLNADTFGHFYKSKPGNKLNGSVNLKCRPRITQETISPCELTQKINQASLDNEGTYYCEIIITSVEETKTFTGPGTKISLYAAPSVEILRPPLLLSGHPVELICNASGFYPQNVSVVWLHRGIPPPASTIHTNDIQRDSTGTFSLRSQYMFNIVQEDHNTECLCQVSHPDWTVKNSSAITLNVSYGPSSLTVTSSAPVSNGSVWAEAGSSVTFVCTADGNPMPEIKWLWGNLSKSHGGDALLIANVQKKDEGLYICVVCNQYGEENTSIHLQVSDRNWTGRLDPLYSLASVFVVLPVVIIVAWRMKKKAPGTHCPHSRPPVSEESITPQAIYAVPDKKRKRLQEHREVLDESHLIYTEITAPAPSRNVESANSMSLYSLVGAKRQKRPEVQQQHTEGTSSVYVLAESPVSDLRRQQEAASPFRTSSHY